MNQLDALAAAIQTMRAVADAGRVDDAAPAGPTPCRGFTVNQLVEHIIDTHNLLLGAAGGQPVTVDGPFAQRHAAVADAVSAQWATRGTDGTIDLGGNDVPAAFGLSLHALETYVHAWDLAASLGRPFAAPTELTEAMSEFAHAFIDDDVRGDFDGAPYAPQYREPAGASDVERLIAFTGRDPRWSRV